MNIVIIGNGVVGYKFMKNFCLKPGPFNSASQFLVKRQARL
jgi:hypothetical protein